MTKDDTPAELELFSEAMNGFVGKATEALLLLQTADPILAATMGGAAGGSAKSVILGSRQLLHRRRERLKSASVTAELESGRTLQQLFEHALDQDDERRLDLFVDVFTAAAREADERKIRAYGRIAAGGVLADDDAKVDVARRIFSTLASLDPADVKVLLEVASPGSPDAWLVDPPREGINRPPSLRSTFPELNDAIDSIVARLETSGLLTTRAEGGITAGTLERVTPFARLCAKALLSEAASE